MQPSSEYSIEQDNLIIFKSFRSHLINYHILYSGLNIDILLKLKNKPYCIIFDKQDKSYKMDIVLKTFSELFVDKRHLILSNLALESVPRKIYLLFRLTRNIDKKIKYRPLFFNYCFFLLLVFF